MVKFTTELVSWDEGRAFMNRMADELGTKIEEINSDLRLNDEDLTVNCHFDERDFSFILVKTKNESKVNLVKSILRQFKKNS